MDAEELVDGANLTKGGVDGAPGRDWVTAVDGDGN